MEKHYIDNIEQGFPFRFLTGGVMLPPIWGGLKGGDSVYKGGE